MYRDEVCRVVTDAVDEESGLLLHQILGHGALLSSLAPRKDSVYLGVA